MQRREGPAQPVVVRPAGQVIERVVQVVTLVHGGGAVSSEEDHRYSPTRRPDALTPIRGTAARGHLRFWWRATHGCALADLAELRAKEDALWGNASAPGLVNLGIEQSLSVEHVPVDRLGGIGTGLRYGAFATANVSRMRGTARIRLTLDPSAAGLAHEVEDALTAWLLFGGIGGRTRRGFGALHVAGSPDPRAFVEGLPGRARVREVPALRGAGSVVLAATPSPSAEEAHKVAVDALRKFRQGPGLGRNQGQQANRPGRSRWPEADGIRRIQKRHAGQHAPVHPVDAFPRAAFGMPIVFQFKDREDPATSQLVPAADGGRMTSPLILRPTQTGGRWYAMAVRLVVPNLDLHRAYLIHAKRATQVRVDLAAAEVAQVSPLAAYGGTPDVLADFLSYFASP